MLGCFTPVKKIENLLIFTFDNVGVILWNTRIEIRNATAMRTYEELFLYRLLLLLSHFIRARLPVTPWTAAYQAPPSMGSSRQEYWSGLTLPSK